MDLLKFIIRSPITSSFLLFSIFYADIEGNSNSRFFSRNIDFEVKYLENHSLAFLKLFHMRTTCIFFLVAL